MSKLTLNIPAELKTILERHPSVQWEGVATDALWNHARRVSLANQLAAKSRMTENDAAAIGRVVKTSLRHRYSEAAK